MQNENTPETTSKIVTVIVVSYYTGSVLKDCIGALLNKSEVIEVIIVDNGNPSSEIQYLDQLSASHSHILVLRPGHNLGFSAACNLAAAQASGQYLAFVNPDLVVAPDTFTNVLSAFAVTPDCWLCGGRLLDVDGAEQRGGRRETLTPWRAFVELSRLDRLFPGHPYFRRFNLLDDPPITWVAEVPAISGAFMVIPRQRFQALGGLDEHMFLHMEDVDLCLRVLRENGKILYCGNIPVIHQGSTSAVSRAFVEWHKTNSTNHYFHKHFRASYPNWALKLISILLWLRFMAVSILAIPSDCAHALRRIQGRN